jgi:hypothetical protein
MHPNQTSYFQPILDRLDVVPSRFDIQRASIVVEGKSDYYILRYAAKMLGRTELPLVPALGAGTFGALAALHVGWNLRFLFVLDGDSKGKSERERYIQEFGIPSARVLTIDSFVASVNEIENLLDNDALDVIRKELQCTGKLTKNHIRRFFQERLASNTIKELSTQFSLRAEKLLVEIGNRLDKT